jgi:5'-nucleotidase
MKSRRIFLKEGAMAMTAMAIGNPMHLLAGQNSILPFSKLGSGKLTILHTNDLHNQLNSTFYKGKYSGGFHKAAHCISTLKNDNHSLLFDCGDICNGNTGDEHLHAKTVQLIKQLGYNAVLLGNRDFETGIDYVQHHWEKTGVTLLNSNTRFNHSWLQASQQPYKIIWKDNIKIGILAASIDMNNLIPSVKGAMHFKDPIVELNAVGRFLKHNEKCNIVICLSHLGFKNKDAVDDITLATRSENIDVILGAHSHTFMTTPYIVMNKQNREVIINHAGCNGLEIGQLMFEFNGHGEKANVQFNNIMV